MDLDADVLRPGHRQKTQWLAFVRQEDVRGVLHHHDLVALGKIDDPRVEIARRNAPGRAVRIVDHQQLGPPRNVGWNRFQVGQEPILFQER